MNTGILCYKMVSILEFVLDEFFFWWVGFRGGLLNDVGDSVCP